MIVWVASFPRSGNTFMRIVMNRRYGVETSVIYDLDGVADRLGPGLIGAVDRAGSIAEMRRSADTFFVKTHRQLDEDVDALDGAICLVRDGRDALVSWARLSSEDDPSGFGPKLQEMVLRDDLRGTGSWGRNVLSWVQPLKANRVLVRYEDLVETPAETIDRAMALVAPSFDPDVHALIPTLADLREVDGKFFRRGRVGSYRDELPEDLHRLFWSRPDNAAAMELLGYDVSNASA
ncbi:MAG TPA: sulfotransferase domain-containing protein [Candidatus Limnocylindrales bacterium]